jgi:hypothetical protein
VNGHTNAVRTTHKHASSDTHINTTTYPSYSSLATSSSPLTGLSVRVSIPPPSASSPRSATTTNPTRKSSRSHSQSHIPIPRNDERRYSNSFFDFAHTSENREAMTNEHDERSTTPKGRPETSERGSTPILPNIYNESSTIEEHEYDLISNYDQLSYIRIPPYLFSLRCTRWFYMLIGILQEPWPWRNHRSLARTPNELRVIIFTQWAWSLICFASILFYAITICEHGESFYLSAMNANNSTDTISNHLHRSWLWLVLSLSMLIASFCSALLAHRITSHRSLSTRIYHVVFNSRSKSPEKSTSSTHLLPIENVSSTSEIDFILFTSLALCNALAVVGIVRDLFLYVPIIYNVPEDENLVNSSKILIHGSNTTNYFLFLFSSLIINFQLSAGVTLLSSLVSVHILRIKSAIGEIKQDGCSIDEAIHQIVDVQLSLTALKSQTENLLAYILFATSFMAALPLLYILTATAENNHNHSIFLVLQPTCIIFFILIQVARINTSCEELKATASIFTLLQRHHQSAHLSQLRKFSEYLRIGIWDFRLLGIRLTTFHVGALLISTCCVTLMLLQFGFISCWPY